MIDAARSLSDCDPDQSNSTHGWHLQASRAESHGVIGPAQTHRDFGVCLRDRASLDVGRKMHRILAVSAHRYFWLATRLERRCPRRRTYRALERFSRDLHEISATRRHEHLRKHRRWFLPVPPALVRSCCLARFQQSSCQDLLSRHKFRNSLRKRAYGLVKAGVLSLTRFAWLSEIKQRISVSLCPQRACVPDRRDRPNRRHS
ncbi:C4-dicarboxylate-specific signal transduction histidine kinase [Bradyrhizobium sp. USDA 4454]